jgi:predicted outer membrane protein
MLSRSVLVAFLAAALLAPATAQAAAPTQDQRLTIPQRLQLQAARIRAGVQAGKISPAERVRLVKAETMLRAHLQAMRQSGRALTPAERQQVIETLNRLNLAIARAIHN